MALSLQIHSIYSIGNWDQFEVNKKLYNVKSTYDENLYTSKLDKSKISRDQQERAARLAAEIESSMSTNVHLREERGQQALQDDNMDEEDRYSGVIRETSTDSVTASASPRQSPGGKWDRAFDKKPSSPPPGHSPLSGSGKTKHMVASGTGNSLSPSSSTTKLSLSRSSSGSNVTGATGASSTDKTEKVPAPAALPSTGPVSATALESTSADIAGPKLNKDDKVNSQSKESEISGSSGEVKKSSGLNPNAKPFTLNASASEWKPPTTAPTPQPGIHMVYPPQAPQMGMMPQQQGMMYNVMRPGGPGVGAYPQGIPGQFPNPEGMMVPSQYMISPDALPGYPMQGMPMYSAAQQMPQVGIPMMYGNMPGAMPFGVMPQAMPGYPVVYPMLQQGGQGRFVQGASSNGRAGHMPYGHPGANMGQGMGGMNMGEGGRGRGGRGGKSGRGGHAHLQGQGQGPMIDSVVIGADSSPGTAKITKSPSI